MKELLEYLFRICGIDGSMDSTPEEALELIKEALAPISNRIRDDAVSEAIAVGKLRLDEREQGRDMAEKNFAVFRAFVKYREPVMLGAATGVRRRNETIVPHALQTSINKQIGVNPEMFAKYNSSMASGGPRNETVVPAALQASINKQIGVTPELFAKHNSPASS
jgi:hypothetical protein